MLEWWKRGYFACVKELEKVSMKEFVLIIYNDIEVDNQNNSNSEGKNANNDSLHLFNA